MSQQDKGHYLIISELTQKPYLDEKRNAHMFLHKPAGDAFARTTGHVMAIDLSEFDFRETCSYVYAAGAKTLLVRGKEIEEEFSLEQDKLKRRYYNPDIQAHLTRFLHTGKDRYIRALSDAYFIVPIRIKNSPGASISYATAKIKDRPYVYVAFTDLDEYYRWDEIVPGWQPLEVDAAGLKRIGSRHGFIINPLGRNLIITRQMIKRIQTKDDEEESYR